MAFALMPGCLEYQHHEVSHFIISVQYALDEVHECTWVMRGGYVH